MQAGLPMPAGAAAAWRALLDDSAGAAGQGSAHRPSGEGWELGLPHYPRGGSTMKALSPQPPHSTRRAGPAPRPPPFHLTYWE